MVVGSGHVYVQVGVVEGIYILGVHSKSTIGPTLTRLDVRIQIHFVDDSQKPLTFSSRKYKDDELRKLKVCWEVLVFTIYIQYIINQFDRKFTGKIEFIVFVFTLKRSPRALSKSQLSSRVSSVISQFSVLEENNKKPINDIHFKTPQGFRLNYRFWLVKAK